MADRHAKRVVALFSACDETVDLLQWMRGISGVNEFLWCRFYGAGSSQTQSQTRPIRDEDLGAPMVTRGSR
jgi:hypothetical protein